MRHPLLCLATLLLSSHLAHAQVSVSQNFVCIAQAVMTAGATSSSASFVAVSGIGQFSSGYLASSASFVNQGGVAFSQPPPPGNPPQPPIVFQVIPPEGNYTGGQTVHVLGSNFLAQGAGATAVLFGGTPGTGVQVLSDNDIQVVAPPGQDPATQNPLGPVDVLVMNGNGSENLTGGYTYQPSIVINPSKPQINKPTELKGDTGSPSFFTSTLGGTIPAFTIPGLTGALTVIPQITITPLTFLPTGEVISQFIVTDASLLGIPLNLQGVGVTSFSPLAGTFTNNLTFVFQP